MAASVITTIILLLAFSTELKSESVYTCPANSGSCECKPTNDVILFECYQGSKDYQFTVLVNITTDELIMECRCGVLGDCSNLYNQDMFAEFNFNSINSVHFMNCPLPNISYSQMFGSINPSELSISTNANNANVKILQQYLFANLTNVSHLVLTGWKISSMEESVFSDLINLDYLDLTVNLIQKLPDGIFNQTTNLTHLSLYGNALTDLPKIHNQLPNLQDLILDSNKFTNLSDNIFQFAPNLKNLSMTHNLLTNLSENVFQNLTELTSLDLTYNELTQLPDHLFQSNINLVELHIRLNSNLSALPSHLLSGAKSLQILDLGRNNLTTLPNDLLSNMTNLHYLDLSHNNLITIPDHFFANSTNLTSINLSINQLSNLPQNLLEPLKNLQEIKLGNNKLSSIGQNLFSALPALTTLDLNNNQIQVIDSAAFRTSDNITWMDLSNNEIRLDINTQVFMLPAQLMHVNLTRNQISFLPTDWTQNANLHNLNLTKNQIQAINTEQINFKSKSAVVDLTYNQIKTVNLNDINHIRNDNDDKKVIKQYIDSIPTILMDYNPINCDCNLLEFVHFLKSRNLVDPNAPFYFGANNLKCALPLNSTITNQALSSIDEDKLYCMLNDSCSPECECRKTPVSEITEVHCEGKKLKQMIQQVPPNASKLYFNDNQLTTLESLQDPRWTSLTEAYFSNNHISNIDKKVDLPKSLLLLTLDGNRLTSLPMWLIDEVNRRKSLIVTLSNNSWNCDCTTLSFYHWLHNSPPEKINDASDVKCGPGAFYNQKLKLLDYTEICPPQNTSSSSAIVVTVLTLLILFSALMFGVYCARRHKFEIKMWLFRRRLCLWLRTDDDIESGHPL